MGLLNRIRDAFRKPEPPPAAPTIRNKPGGMAWINPQIDSGDGSSVLVGHIVTTTRPWWAFWRR